MSLLLLSRVFPTQSCPTALVYKRYVDLFYKDDLEQTADPRVRSTSSFGRLVIVWLQVTHLKIVGSNLSALFLANLIVVANSASPKIAVECAFVER